MRACKWDYDNDRTDAVRGRARYCVRIITGNSVYVNTEHAVFNMYVCCAVDNLVCISTYLTCNSSTHMHAKEGVLHLSHSIGYTARLPGIWSGLAG